MTKFPKVPLFLMASVNDEALSETTDPNFRFDYVDISSVENHQILPHLQSYTFENAPSRARRKVKRGDVVVSTVRTYLRAITSVETEHENLVFSTGFAVVRPKPSLCDPEFLRAALLSNEFINNVVSNSNGVSYPAINASDLMRLRVPLPDLETQRRIADYLDKEISEMDALIEEFEELVKNLELKRSLEINQVFKKLEPRLPIGYVVNTKTNGTMINGETIPAEGEEFGVLKTSAVSTGAFKPTQNKKILPEEQHLATVPVTGGTLLINRLNSPDYVGSCAYVESDFPTLFVSDKIWKLDLTINNRFFHYWTFTNDYRHQVREAIVGTSSSMQSLSYNAFLRYKMPVPDEETQNSVVSDLDRTFERMDALIEESTQLIENLKARKTALITDVVTGRKEV